MSFKFCLVIVVAFAAFQFLTTSEALIVRRDTPAAEKNASQTIDEALQSFKSGIDDLVKNVQVRNCLTNYLSFFYS
nr:unnamed protein product [Callosobruchus analis]